MPNNYWAVEANLNCYKDDYYNKNIVCTECTPSEYDDGSLNKDAGKWHNKFSKNHWSKIGSKEKIIKICKENQGNYVNAEEYFKNHNMEEK
jgi:hypothetical protein